MTSKFSEAIGKTLVNEGGFSDDEFDLGGKTNFGITYETLQTAIKQGIVPRETNIKTLTKDEAILIYEKLYWDKLKLDRIESQAVASKIFDTSVNVGLHWAVVIVQRAVHASTGELLREDGILGTKTLAAINNAPAGALLASMRSEQAGYYRLIVANDSTQSRFFGGWSRRAYE